ncbi:uncharacterized protein LOC135202621 [Macrobrachium nipponense]|uniref:uncharacterized protein LOC135202621 n=1 Tax=Macrobrachium nipponense TaxID=159736 RepID=UPI0030C87241
MDQVQYPIQDRARQGVEGDRKPGVVLWTLWPETYDVPKPTWTWKQFRRYYGIVSSPRKGADYGTVIVMESEEIVCNDCSQQFDNENRRWHLSCGLIFSSICLDDIFANENSQPKYWKRMPCGSFTSVAVVSSEFSENDKENFAGTKEQMFIQKVQGEASIKTLSSGTIDQCFLGSNMTTDSSEEIMHNEKNSLHSLAHILPEGNPEGIIENVYIARHQEVCGETFQSHEPSDKSRDASTEDITVRVMESQEIVCNKCSQQFENENTTWRLSCGLIFCSTCIDEIFTNENSHPKCLTQMPCGSSTSVAVVSSSEFSGNGTEHFVETKERMLIQKAQAEANIDSLTSATTDQGFRSFKMPTDSSEEIVQNEKNSEHSPTHTFHEGNTEATIENVYTASHEGVCGETFQSQKPLDKSRDASTEDIKERAMESEVAASVPRSMTLITCLGSSPVVTFYAQRVWMKVLEIEKGFHYGPPTLKAPNENNVVSDTNTSSEELTEGTIGIINNGNQQGICGEKNRNLVVSDNSTEITMEATTDTAHNVNHQKIVGEKNLNSVDADDSTEILVEDLGGLP